MRHTVTLLLSVAVAAAATAPGPDLSPGPAECRHQPEPRLFGLHDLVMTSFEIKKAIFCQTFCRNSTQFWCNKCASVTTNSPTIAMPSTTNEVSSSSSLSPFETVTTMETPRGNRSING